MTKWRVSRKSSVIRAIREFDTLGRDAFLTKYGFGRAKSYFVIHEGSYYDSKAILGAAHGFESGTPLTADEFRGGNRTVRPALEALGFVVVCGEMLDKIVTLSEEVSKDAWEGARSQVWVNRFERNSEARLKCIERFGAVCAICSFDFSTFYGEEFVGYIHVHHLIPLSKIGKRYKVDPVTDLVPVCPNCHAVIHFGRKCRTVNDIKRLIQVGRSRRH